MNLSEARLADHIRRVVDEAPPLTQEQRTRLAALLGPDSGRAADDDLLAALLPDGDDD